MAAALILRDGAPQFVDGVPTLRAGFFPIKHAKILNTWSTAGMRGTGSNDCVFENVFVPDEFTFDWLNAQPTWQRGPFANIPLQLQMAGALAAVVLGTARHALDALNEIAQAKVPVATRGAVARAADRADPVRAGGRFAECGARLLLPVQRRSLAQGRGRRELQP